MQSVTDQESPWQNGRAERHGLWIKDRICGMQERMVQPRRIQPSSCTARTPGSQPSCCQMPARPHQDGMRLSATLPRETRPLQSSEGIMEHASREKVREACKPPLHRHRVWSAGQWVMIWRTSRQAVTRSRWVGPGIVIMQNGHTVYVAVRSRLWKCNTDQLRPASQTEEMAMQVIASRQYRDLLGQMQKQRSGAVDVEREGTPPPEAWQQPVQRSEEAATLSMPPPPSTPEGENEEQGAEERRAALRAAATRQGPIRPIPEGRTNTQVLGPRGLPQMTREEVRRGSLYRL